MLAFGTAMTRVMKFVSRSIGVSPGIVTFIGAAFCREAAARRGEYVRGSSFLVSTV